MASQGITIKGSKEWLATIKSVSSATVQKRIARTSVRAVAADTRKVMKQLANKDDGDLRRSLIVVVRNKGYNMTAYVGASEAYTNNGKRPWNYDHLANDGHETPDGRSVPGTHYVERTYEATHARAEQVMTDKAVKQLERELAKGAR